MWTDAARRTSFERVPAACAECAAPITVCRIHATRANYCQACADKRRAWYHTSAYARLQNPAGYERRNRERIAKRSAERAANRMRRGPAPIGCANGADWLTLEHDAGDFLRGAVLTFGVWHELAGYGDLDGAELQDTAGRRYLVDGCKLGQVLG